VDPSDTGLLSRPPGYSILLAAIYRVVGRGFFAAQLVQNVLNALVPVLVFLLADTLVGRRSAIGAGLLAALLPQLAYYSALLTPDVVCAIPVLLALVLLVPVARGRRVSIVRAILAGAMLGLSVWLRPNLLLLGPTVAAGGGPAGAVRRSRRWAIALAVAAGVGGGDRAHHHPELRPLPRLRAREHQPRRRPLGRDRRGQRQRVGHAHGRHRRGRAGGGDVRGPALRRVVGLAGRDPARPRLACAAAWP
jgi:hypothetical protein